MTRLKIFSSVFVLVRVRHPPKRPSAGRRGRGHFRPSAAAHVRAGHRQLVAAGPDALQVSRESLPYFRELQCQQLKKLTTQPIVKCLVHQFRIFFNFVVEHKTCLQTKTASYL
jgi:hypothetical protein